MLGTDLLADPDLSREAGFGFCSVKSLDPSSPDGGISLLYIMESIITNYCTTQMVKYQNSFKYMPLVSLDQASIDGSYSQSQQTSSSSSSSSPSCAEVRTRSDKPSSKPKNGTRFSPINT